MVKLLGIENPEEDEKREKQLAEGRKIALERRIHKVNEWFESVKKLKKIAKKKNIIYYPSLNSLQKMLYENKKQLKIGCVKE